MLQQQVPVVSNAEIAPRYFHMVLQAPDIARAARPGQFIHARAAEQGSWDPLLRRPLSIFWADAMLGRVALLYRVGTTSRAFRWLSGRQQGETIDVMGPLGEGVFQFEREAPSRPVLVGGGVGIPPLYFLATRMAEAGIRPDACLGFSDSDSVIWTEQFSKLCRRVVVTTQDGVRGRKGLVTDPLTEWLDGTGNPDGALGPVFACGPEAMMRAVNEMCRSHRVPVQLSLEERMACGVGACLSCIALVDEDRAVTDEATADRAVGERAYALRKRICVEGPVFPGEAVIFS